MKATALVFRFVFYSPFGASTSCDCWSMRRRPLLSIDGLRGALGPCRFQFRSDLGPLLEPAINGFKSLKRTQQLQGSFTHLICARAKPFDVLDRKSDPIDRNARLVRHFKLNCGRPRLHFSFDRLEDLTQDIRTHRLLNCPQPTYAFGD